MVKDPKRTAAFSRLQDLGILPSQLLKPCQIQVSPSLSDGCDCWSSHLQWGHIPEVLTCIKRTLMQLLTHTATDSPAFAAPLCSPPQFTCNLLRGSQRFWSSSLCSLSNRCMGLHSSQVSSCSWTLQILAEALSPVSVLAPWTCAAISTDLGSFQMQVSCCPAGSLLMNYTCTQD